MLWEVLEANVKKILKPTILGKYGVRFSIFLKNNLRKNDSKILILKTLRKFFAHFGNSLRKYGIGNSEEIYISSEILRKF